MTTPVAIPAMTPIPPFPALGDRAVGTYNLKAYNFGAHMAGVFNTELTAVAAAARTCALSAQESATAAAGSVGAAATQAGLATTNGQAQVALAVAQVVIATAKAAQTASDALATAADRVQTALDRTAAAASAASAAAVAGAFVGTSTTSVTVGTGPKSFATQVGEQYTGNVYMTAVSASNSNLVMFGQLGSYNSNTGALVLNVSYASGTGATATDWNLSLSGPQGATGPQGTPGAGVVPQVTGFTLTGGNTTQKTLTVDQTASISGMLAAIAAAGANILRVPRSANTVLGLADKGKLFDATGTFTQTVDAAAALGLGWWCLYQYSGTGAVTVDPNASELIDGITSGVILPGMLLLITCDGGSFYSMKIGPMVTQILTSGTSWVCPLGVRRAKEKQVGGGGSGGVQGTTASGVGGAGGGYAEKTFTTTPGTSYAYSIGAGGAAATGSGAAGNAGGTTTFNTGVVVVTTTGGNGGPAADPQSSTGGVASNGDININGGSGMSYSVNGGITRTLGGGTPLGQPTNSSASGYGSGGPGMFGAGSSSPGQPGVIILEY